MAEFARRFGLRVQPFALVPGSAKEWNIGLCFVEGVVAETVLERVDISTAPMEEWQWYSVTTRGPFTADDLFLLADAVKTSCGPLSGQSGDFTVLLDNMSLTAQVVGRTLPVLGCRVG